MSKTLTFDPEQHEYKVDDIHVPGVNEIMGDLGFISDFIKNKGGATYGTNVHDMIKIYDEDDLDEETLSEGLKNPLLAYKRFRADNPNLKPKLAEEVLYSSVYGFAGTPDLLFYNNGFYDLYDIKTSVVVGLKNAELQTSAYQILCEENLAIKVKRRFILKLSPDSKEPGIIELKDKTAKNIFISAVNCYKYKHRK